LDKKVYKVPDFMDRRIAKLKLESLGIRIDTLTKEQKEYLDSWEIGT
ncbi:MAG: adenosylhomocysteinase, partial [Candidatus Omnitrophota bacterium]|nr:adenosylhomocysteinase [Candidatus Omnitrophota bacterium]